MRRVSNVRGLSLVAGTGFIDVIVGTAILLIVFLGIFGTIRLAVKVIGLSKAKVGATALANDQIEFIRSFSYDNVGTQGGIPTGNIPQEETIVLNNITYTRRTLVQYIDAPEDGEGAADENGITADYKVAKVELTWDIRNKQRTLALVTNVVPKGIETITGGGTLVINVIDAIGIPVAGADVKIVNNMTNPPVDVTVSSNTQGKVTFPGSPAASSYEVTVFNGGYSTAKTYTTSAENPNPSPGHLTVNAGQTTTATFQIDIVSTKTVRTFSPPQTLTWSDFFDDTIGIASTTNTEVIGGELRLLDSGGGVYLSQGDVLSVTTTPTVLDQWTSASWDQSVSASTNVIYQVYSNNIAIPDIDLVGNIAGFTVGPINLSTLSTTTYNNIQLFGALSTIDDSVTPAILDWQIDYSEGRTPLSNIVFLMQGNKTIGTDGGGSPIYKYNQDLQTDGNGTIAIPSLEWDTYLITVDGPTLGLDISESCSPQPYTLSPNTTVTTDLVLVSHTNNSLLIDVQDTSGVLLFGASVRLYRLPGYDQAQTTGSCSQTFFSGLAQGTVLGGDAYAVDVSLSGYQSTTVTDVEVQNAARLRIILQPI